MNQVNVPGTVHEHPNWRRRLPAMLEDLPASSALPAVTAIMDTSGRSSGGASH
jgi:4-alpha-glucanotransferase